MYKLKSYDDITLEHTVNYLNTVLKDDDIQVSLVNQGNFCMECGAKKPAGAPLYRCDKCGWQPEDPHNPPKFCMNCGDPFNQEDQQ